MGWESRLISPVRALGRGEPRSSGSLIPWRSGHENECLCCAKTKAVMSGLDGNVRSPRATRKREIHQPFSFIKSGLCAVCCYFFTRFAILSFMLSPLPLCPSLYFSLSFQLLLIYKVIARKRSTVTSILSP